MKRNVMTMTIVFVIFIVVMIVSSQVLLSDAEKAESNIVSQATSANPIVGSLESAILKFETRVFVAIPLILGFTGLFVIGWVAYFNSKERKARSSFRVR